ncbi:MAG: glycosyltransferase [Thaumarchaeota archaeon]|nr:glycosyltransferase [Nitrososphaerota archaeon]
MSSITESKVSVIIPTKNSGRTLERCLSSVRRQSYTHIEIIIVDNHSVDETPEVAKKLADKVYCVDGERSSARNIGSRMSTGRFLLFIDSDMILDPKVIEECIDVCSKNCIGIYVPEIIIGEGYWVKVRNFERSFYNGTVIDALRFVRRDVFEDVGGFDESLIAGEDWDLDRRIRGLGKVGTIKSYIMHDEGRFRTPAYLAKKEYYAKQLENYVVKWGASDPIIKKQLGPRYRLLDVFLENGKWKKLLRYPHLWFSMMWLRLMVGVIYLKAQPRNTHVRPNYAKAMNTR